MRQPISGAHNRVVHLLPRGVLVRPPLQCQSLERSVLLSQGTRESRLPTLLDTLELSDARWGCLELNASGRGLIRLARSQSIVFRVEHEGARLIPQIGSVSALLGRQPREGSANDISPGLLSHALRHEALAIIEGALSFRTLTKHFEPLRTRAVCLEEIMLAHAVARSVCRFARCGGLGVHFPAMLVPIRTLLVTQLLNFDYRLFDVVRSTLTLALHLSSLLGACSNRVGAQGACVVMSAVAPSALPFLDECLPTLALFLGCLSCRSTLRLHLSTLAICPSWRA
mmetsp:Transcript_16523/g.42403  ORF Transcript_16523/g.42403 Transcript_16523/m.42403 type:complete len:284 (+) Transcript_16523:405-1256(+)